MLLLASAAGVTVGVDRIAGVGVAVGTSFGIAPGVPHCHFS